MTDTCEYSKESLGNIKWEVGGGSLDYICPTVLIIEILRLLFGIGFF